MIGQRMESIAPSYNGRRCIFTEEQKDMIFSMSERMPICKIAEYAGVTICVIRRVLIEKGYRHGRERTNKMISRGMSVSEKNQAIPMWQKDMAGWCNKRMCFVTCDFKDFQPRKGFRCDEYFKMKTT